MTEGPTLRVEGLEVRYGEAQALASVTLAARAGQITSIIGANGAGKTTLIRAIAGMLRPRKGTVLFRGEAITGLDSAEICERGIGQVPEGRQIFPTLTVQDNLRVGGLLRRARAHARRNEERVYGMFPRLAERRRQQAGTLSGGEQQMLAIGRCLMADPALIMLDEPSLGLSPVMTEQMFDIVLELHRQGLTVLLVEQNVADSIAISSESYVLENGRVAVHGSGTELLDDERIRTSYLGL